MTSPGRRFGLGLAVAVAVSVSVLGIWYVLVLRDGGADAATGSAGIAVPAATDATPAAGADTAPPSRIAQARALADTPLPPSDQPLRLIHDELVARAGRGDARAACRVAAEHERCDGQRQQLRALQGQDAQQQALRERAAELPQQARDAAGAAQARTRERIAALETAIRHCEGIAPADPATRARYWRQAALAGHVPSMRHYASGNAFRFHDLMDALPALQTYRGEAEAVATRAAAQGDVASMYALAVAYSDGGTGHFRTFLAQSVTPDLAQALAWYRLLDAHPDIRALPDADPRRRVIRDGAAGLAAAATADEDAAARRIAARFPGAATPGEAPAHQVGVFENGGMRDVGPEVCDSRRFAE
ncbi:hypothetical protein LDO26_12685 [Luteimonas sp. BDR2-5]|uniref:hypothetical protein n=1 Tax=Proluteimonas luteida TaxID=2878685 RepID=UPI001E6530CA|nr:hypothetical protein [Luteimonas sp. BDR2-5]MCD9029057.1 hypothetical protein [Luteimonas sp. BDR2-5]